MKVSLLTVIVVGVLPGDLLAQQSGYLQHTTRVHHTQQAESVPAPQGAGARIEPEYRFPIAISITASGYQNGQKRENSVVTYYINPAEGWVATASTCDQRASKAGSCAGMAIYDLKASTMLVVNTREKRGVSTSMPTVAATSAQRRRELNLPPPGENGCHCDKTGKKKVIEGFRTEQYSCTNPGRNTRFDMWVTRDLKTDLAAPGSQTELSGFMHRAARLGGVPLEGYYYVNGDMMSSLMLTGVNRAAHFSVNTSEYKLNKGRN
jgi:hypothetical protein